MKPLLFSFFVLAVFGLVAFTQNGVQISTEVKTNKALLMGIWQSNTISNKSFTNAKLVDQQQSTIPEVYSFFTNTNFSLTQGSFSIKGKWTTDTEGSKVIVTTESGEILEWKILALSNEQLKLFRVETVQVGSKTHRLETLVDCSRIIQ